MTKQLKISPFMVYTCFQSALNSASIWGSNLKRKEKEEKKESPFRYRG